MTPTFVNQKSIISVLVRFDFISTLSSVSFRAVALYVSIEYQCFPETHHYSADLSTEFLESSGAFNT